MEPILISEISSIGYEIQLLRAPVSQIFPSKKIAQGMNYECENCGFIQNMKITINSEKIPVPKICPMDRGCGSTRKSTQFIPLDYTGEFKTHTKIRFYHRGTWFNLTLISEKKLPNKHDWIEFKCVPEPILKGKPTISNWRGVSKDYKFIGVNKK